MLYTVRRISESLSCKSHQTCCCLPEEERERYQRLLTLQMLLLHKYFRILSSCNPPAPSWILGRGNAHPSICLGPHCYRGAACQAVIRACAWRKQVLDMSSVSLLSRASAKLHAHRAAAPQAPPPCNKYLNHLHSVVDDRWVLSPLYVS